MNQKRCWKENKTYCKLKKRQKYNRKPQTLSRQWHASCGQVKEVHDGTVHGWEPRQKCTCAHKSQQSTKKNKQANLKRGKKYNKKHQKMMFDCIMVVQ